MHRVGRCFAAIGSFSICNDVTDFWIMFTRGIVIYFLNKFKYPGYPQFTTNFLMGRFFVLLGLVRLIPDLFIRSRIS